jgi:hypothetical protein
MRLIDVDALLEKLDALSELFRRRGENEDKGFLAVQCGVIFAAEEVNDAPTVDAAPVVHARWDPITRIFKYSKQWTCSVCGIPSLTNRHKFCPGCGARMDAKED